MLSDYKRNSRNDTWTRGFGYGGTRHATAYWNRFGRLRGGVYLFYNLHRCDYLTTKPNAAGGTPPCDR